MLYKSIQRQMQPRMLAILLISLLFLTLLFAYLYVLKLPIKEFNQSKQALQLLENEVKTGIPLEKQIAHFQKQIEKLNVKLRGTDSQLPVSQMIAFVIGQLDKIADQQNVKLISVEPETSKTILTFREFPFHIELQGSYFSLFNWLYQVDQQLGPIVIKQFEITATATTTTTTTNRNINLVLASYQFIEQ